MGALDGLRGDSCERKFHHLRQAKSRPPIFICLFSSDSIGIGVTTYFDASAQNADKAVDSSLFR